MIANFTGGGDPGGLARYLLGYKEKGQKTDKQATVLGSAGVRTDTLAHLITDFELGAKLHPELGKAVLHISLSFNPDDAARMTDQKMRQVAEEYMVEMGMEGTQYMLVRHRDRPHQHLHIMANRVADDGHTIADSNNYLASKKVLAKLIAKHELTPANENRPHLQHPKRLRGKDLDKHKMRTVLDEELTTETQRPALLAALQARGIAHREFLDKEGNVTGISLQNGKYACKGSALGPDYSSAAIDKRLAANREKALEVASQQTKWAPLAGPVAAGTGVDQAPLLPALPAVKPVGGEAVGEANGLIQPSTGLGETTPSAVPPLVKATPVAETATGKSEPKAPETSETQGAVTGQREAAAPPLVSGVPVDITAGASAAAVESAPPAPAMPAGGIALSGPLAAVWNKAASAAATSVAASSEGQQVPPTEGVATPSVPAGPAAGPAAVLPGEPAAAVIDANTASEPVSAVKPLFSSSTGGAPAEESRVPVTYSSRESKFEQALARWEAQKQADEDESRVAEAYHNWQQRAEQVQQQVTAATHEALATGVAFSTLLDRQGLELLPATGNVPVCVRHRASGESFLAEEVTLPSLLLTTAGQASAQYGVVQMANTDLRKAPERLAQVRAHLLEVGLTVGLVEPATAHKPAQLNWAFNPQQADLDLTLVMAKLDAVQASPNAWVLEAPHAWQTGSGKGVGLAEPQLYWGDRAGQFNQARLELGTIDQHSAGRVERLRQALSEQRVSLGPVQTDEQGRLGFELRYHTLAPTIDNIDTVLIRARNSGFDLRESEQQQQARIEGIPVVAKRDAGKEYSRG